MKSDAEILKEAQHKYANMQACKDWETFLACKHFNITNRVKRRVQALYEKMKANYQQTAPAPDNR